MPYKVQGRSSKGLGTGLDHEWKANTLKNQWLVSSVIKWLDHVCDCLLDGGMNPFGRFSVQSMSAGKQDMMVRYE